MKYVSIFVILLVVLVIVGCGHGRTNEASSTKATEPTTVTDPGTSSLPQVNQVNSDPAKNEPAVTNTQPVITTNTSKSSAGLNPAHGQPGHRCEIAVGAPLDSKPTTTTNVTQPVITQNNNTTITPVINPTVNPVNPATPQTGAKGLNPAHGQPGHRCEIPVGAPLDGKPAQKSSSSVTQPVISTINNPAYTSSVTPVNPASNQPVAKGLNPAHGQPGHRCDIAVGEPLNSKPEQQSTVASKPYTPVFNLVKSAADSSKQ